MKFKCDKCDKPATIHLTEIIDGDKLEKHLCQECAAHEGITIKADVPISQLLEDFILQSTGAVQEPEAACDICGITFTGFRESGLLGCPNDYDVFEQGLRPLIEHSQEGASQHTGKLPHNAGESEKVQQEISRLRTQLKAAIAVEDYERAAQLRDRVKELENS